MFSREELASLSDQERSELMKALVSIGVRPVSPTALWQRRALVVGWMLGFAAILAAWVIYLSGTLPSTHPVNGWRVAWIGFDVAEVVGAVLTAWAAWRYRHIVIACAVVTGTLFIADAWFDVVLSWRSPDWPTSVALALLVEIPAGLGLWEIARRLFLGSLAAARATYGLGSEVPPLRKLTLLVPASYPAKRTHPTPDQDTDGAQSARVASAS